MSLIKLAHVLALAHFNRSVKTSLAHLKTSKLKFLKKIKNLVNYERKSRDEESMRK